MNWAEEHAWQCRCGNPACLPGQQNLAFEEGTSERSLTGPENQGGVTPGGSTPLPSANPDGHVCSLETCGMLPEYDFSKGRTWRNQHQHKVERALRVLYGAQVAGLVMDEVLEQHPDGFIPSGSALQKMAEKHPQGS